MKKLIDNLKPEKIWPFAIVITGLLLSASITFASFPFSAKREVVIEKPVETKTVLGLETTASPSLTPAFPTVPPSTTPKIIVAAKPSPTPSPISPVQQSNPTPQSASVIIQVIATPTPSSTPNTSPSPTPEPSPSPITQTVAIEIKQPDATLNFTLEISEGMNACQVMQKAKDEGKINSLTINDKYLETFGTLLIEEINGYKNNWVFTVNGESPMGCSLITLKNNDKVVWEFLNL